MVEDEKEKGRYNVGDFVVATCFGDCTGTWQKLTSIRIRLEIAM